MSPNNKHIRKAIMDRLEAATGWVVFDTAVPPDLVPQPEKYILVNGTVKTRFGDSKLGHEWLCSTQIHIVSIQEKGFVSSEVVDDTEVKVVTSMPGLEVSGYRTKFTRLLDSRPSTIQHPAQTIVRTVLVYEQWLGSAIPEPVT